MAFDALLLPLGHWQRLRLSQPPVALIIRQAYTDIMPSRHRKAPISSVSPHSSVGRFVGRSAVEPVLSDIMIHDANYVGFCRARPHSIIKVFSATGRLGAIIVYKVLVIP